MKFCPECGAKLEGSQKFCSECGTKISATMDAPPPQPVTQEPIPQIPTPTKSPEINRYELGKRLEDVVESIYRADGYATQRRQRIQGVVKGYSNEIDIIATRGSEKIAIECKNFSNPVGISQVRDFAEKILDLGPGWRGIFVGYNDFTEDASHFAECRNIEQLAKDEVMEKWFALSVGRSSRQGEKITIEQALPVKVDFLKATSLDLVNGNKITISDAKLIFHPYIRYKYTFRRVFHDPTRAQHKFEDHGTVVIDLIDDHIVNKSIMKDAGGFAKSLTAALTSKGKEENTLRKLLYHEVSDNMPLSEIPMTIGQDYRVTKLPFDYSKRDVNRTALEYVIDKNSRRVSYSVDTKSGFPDMRHVDFVPDRNDISIDKGEVVCVPKWLIHFNAFNTIYTREILACSGKKIEDTIGYCPNHFKMGILEVHKKNTAVCEKCGDAFCDAHIRQCEVCKIFLCEDHSKICSSCGEAFCDEHITKICGICGKLVCEDCITKCKICGKDVGADHLKKCDVCGKSLCPDCMNVSGLIRKKTVCNNCK